MKAAYIILISALFLSSCGIFKKTSKKTNKSLLDSSVVKHEQTVFIDTGSTTIYESVDSSVITPERRIKAVIPLMPGIIFTGLRNNLLNLSDSFFDLKISVDSLDNSLNIDVIKKPEKIAVRFNKTTIQKNGITSTSKKDEKANVKKKVIEKDKVATPDYNWMVYLFFILLFILMLGIFWPKLKYAINKIKG